MSLPVVNLSEKTLFTIEEVCEIVDVQAHVLRYWETEFPMLSPQKNRAGQRSYGRRDVEIALRIKELLYDDSYTIAGAKNKLSSELGIQISNKRDEPRTLVAQLLDLRNELKSNLIMSNPEIEKSFAVQDYIIELEDKTDIEIIELANLQLSESQQETLHELLEKNSEGDLTKLEKKYLDGLMEVYNDALLTKATAIRIAVERGLMKPLSAE